MKVNTITKNFNQSDNIKVVSANDEIVLYDGKISGMKDKHKSLEMRTFQYENSIHSWIFKVTLGEF